jgi:hypothetical protein
MFSTFADVFATDGNDTTKDQNGTTTNPFDSLSTNVDPFGVSTDMKLSASSQRFEDSPFVIDATKQTSEEYQQSSSDSQTLPMSPWNTMATSTPSVMFDPFDDAARKTSNLSINNITHSKSINLIDPFLIPTDSHETVTTAPNQVSHIDLLFDLNVDPSTLPLSHADNSLAHTDQVLSSYDLLGLNRMNPSSSTAKVMKSDSLTDIPKTSQTKNTSSASLLARTAIPSAASYHTLPSNTTPTSPSTLRVQATALSIMTGTTSTTPFDDQFLDWLTQSDDLMCGVDPKLTGTSKKMDINMMKSTEDLLGSIYRPVTTLATLRTSLSH